MINPIQEETIAAISTPIGEGGIGIVRLSGKDAISIVSKLFAPRKGSFSTATAKANQIYFGHIKSSQNEVIDEVLVSVFKSPHSYTAEDIVEINAHGSLVSLKQILHLVLKAGARVAEPGEFTKRAFLNGRLDLTQAEAVLDTIRAKTDLALKSAMNQLQGSVSREVQAIKNDIMKIYAHMEACLDFPEEHLEIYANQEFKNRLLNAESKIELLISSFAKGEIMREGILAVIVGRPNVGKSSLLNTLLKRDRALVSEVPGTTRDALEETIQLNGIAIKLVDTAGLFASNEPLTQASMAKTKEYLERGDLFLFVFDAESGFSNEDLKIINDLSGKKAIVIANKMDLCAKQDQKNEILRITDKIFSESPCFVSAKQGTGIDYLEERIVQSIWSGRVECESAMITRLRHKRALEESLEALKRAYQAFGEKKSLELVTLDLKHSLDALREMIGEVYSEDLLDVIFKEFCIGK